jgi:hypothetical protein
MSTYPFVIKSGAFWNLMSSLREPAAGPTARICADGRRRHITPRRQPRKVAVGTAWPSAQNLLGRRPPSAQLSRRHTPRLCRRHATYPSAHGQMVGPPTATDNGVSSWQTASDCADGQAVGTASHCLGRRPGRRHSFPPIFPPTFPPFFPAPSLPPFFSRPFSPANYSRRFSPRRPIYSHVFSTLTSPATFLSSSTLSSKKHHRIL